MKRKPNADAVAAMLSSAFDEVPPADTRPLDKLQAEAHSAYLAARHRGDWAEADAHWTTYLREVKSALTFRSEEPPNSPTMRAGHAEARRLTLAARDWFLAYAAPALSPAQAAALRPVPTAELAHRLSGLGGEHPLGTVRHVKAELR